MVNGFSKWATLILFAAISIQYSVAQNTVQATALVHDIKDLSQRSSKVYDQNGERCALIKFETPIPTFFTFNLGAQQIEKRENKDDEVWIWVSEDVKKMTIRCSDCISLKDYRVALKSGNVYRAKLTTGLPQEKATTQNVNIFCERTPFYISIDGSAPVLNASRNYYTELPIGAHEINVSSKLYKPYSATIRVYRSRPYMDTIRLEENWGELQVTASQSSYSLYVDDELQKHSRSVRLEPGKHKVSIRKDRYQAYEEDVEIKLGETAHFYATLLPAFSVHLVKAADEDTEIYLDGEYKGRGKANVEIVWGEHQLEGRREGYDPFVYPIKDFNADSEKTISIPKLNMQYGALRLSVYPPLAYIYLDGKQVPSNDGVYQVSRIATGTHFVQFRLTDYAPIRDSIKVQSGQLTARDYTMTPIPIGWVAINTDPDIGIYHLDQETKEPSFIGHTSMAGKLPAGENIIELRNLEGYKCHYHLFVADKQELKEPIQMPFKRKLMIRTNAAVGDIVLQDTLGFGEHVHANKKLVMNPVRYSIAIDKKGYEPYRDTIDLSQQGVNYLIYHADLKKQGDTLAADPSKKPYESPKVFQKFYDNAGKWYIGLFNFGYSFDLNGDTKYLHQAHFGSLALRYRIAQVNLADFEITVNDGSWKEQVYYRPKLSVVLPCAKGLAFTVYGGLAVNLYDWSKKAETIRTYALGGASMKLNSVGKFPVDIFAEYKWPVYKGADTSKEAIGAREQLFRFGISFSSGIDF